MTQFKWLSLLVCLALLLGLPVNAAAVRAVPQDPEQRDPNIIQELITGNPLDFFHPQEGPVSQPAQAWVPDPTPPAWSRLAFQSFRYDNWDIYLVHPSGAAETRLTDHAATESSPSLAKGGQQVAFVSNRSGNNDIYTQNTDGSGLATLVAGPANDIYPVWAPDNSRVVYQSDAAGNYDIYVTGPAGPVQLTTSTGYDGEPTWSPDGARLAFVSDRSGTREIWAMNADGSNPQQLTHAGTAATPAWSPLGDRIAFATDDTKNGFYNLFLINVDGSDLTKITYGYLDTYSKVDRWNPAWSPDGKWLAIAQTGWLKHSTNTGAVTWSWYNNNISFYYVSTKYYAPVSFNDGLIWKASWASTDVTPPTACTVNLRPYQGWESFFVNWSASDAPAGVSTYDIQVRDLPGGAWRDFMNDTAQSAAVFPGKNGQRYEFRCRGRDAARNASAWENMPLTTTEVQTGRPFSVVEQPARYVKGNRVNLNWTGNAAAGSLTTYDILVRDGQAGDWTPWLNATTATTAEFSGETGHTYFFRSQAHDQGNHTQVWQPEAQAVVTFYSDTPPTGSQRTFIPLISKFGVSPARFTPPVPSDWLMSGYDPQHTSYVPNQPDTSRYAQVWSVTPQSSYPLPPMGPAVVADGIVVISNSAYSPSRGTYAYDLASGAERWRFQNPSTDDINPVGVSNGAVYLQRYISSEQTTYLYCLDLYTGQQLWRKEISNPDGSNLQPMIVEQKIYYGARGSVVIYDASSGALLGSTPWQSSDNSRIPAYADGKLYTWLAETQSPQASTFFSEANAANGALNWTLSVPGSMAGLAPVIKQRTAVVIGNMFLGAIDLDTHTLRWSNPGDHGYYPPAIAGDLVYALHTGKLETQKLSTGEHVGFFSAFGPIRNTPVVSDKNVYVSTDTTTYILDRATLKTKSTLPKGGWLTVSNGFLVIAGTDGVLSVYRAQ